MFVESYLKTAINVLNEYKGIEPFASFLKKYFATNKKYGSRDRKQIAHLCYCYFRLGKSLNGIDLQERILTGLFLCSQLVHPLLAYFKPEWNDLITEDISSKTKVLQQKWRFEVTDIFPFADHLSPVIDHHSFASSFLIQPDIYLRIRPSKESFVKKTLKRAEVPFVEISGNCIAVSPSTKLEAHLEINRDVVVQDVNSQKVLEPLLAYVKDTSRFIQSWDCCAASGGKSILLKDKFSNSQITVSDIRESILINLRKRFMAAGITDYRSFVADVSSLQFRHNKQYDLIICDAPCSGSGTWGRTPEQLYFFELEKIARYSDLQLKIALNASRYLKEKGLFLYITCSVFMDENERIVEKIQQESSLQLQTMQYFTGYHDKADSLFTALFVRKIN